MAVKCILLNRRKSFLTTKGINYWIDLSEQIDPGTTGFASHKFIPADVIMMGL